MSANKALLLGLKLAGKGVPSEPIQSGSYCIFMIHSGSGVFHSDFGKFPFSGPVLLFSTPLQILYFQETELIDFSLLEFHGDFYCIEYHRQEVACNGILFNTLYIQPALFPDTRNYGVLKDMLNRIGEELSSSPVSELVIRAYLQLFLAKCSQLKSLELSLIEAKAIDEQMERFRFLLEENFLTMHRPSDYASALAMTPNNFSKRCFRYFGRTPTHMIAERIILEAKKELHLTRKTIKEIAHKLKFDDEFYFSRYFKKYTQLSPQSFRNIAGISIVADRYR